MTQINSRGYANADALVSTGWVAKHANDDGVRIVESNEDPLLYPSGHIPGAVEIDWAADLNDPLRRDYLDRDGFASLMLSKGISNDTTVVLYGDRSNWWACYALWIFQLFGHTNAKIMDGGRMKWEAEGRELTREAPDVSAADYSAPERDDSKVRAFRDEVLVSHWELRQVDRRPQPGRVSWRAAPHARLPERRCTCEAVTSPALPTSRGLPPQMRTARSRTLRLYETSTKATLACRPTKMSSFTAASASVRATPGSYSPTSWVTATSRTTTAAGPSGATRSAYRSRSRSITKRH